MRRPSAAAPSLREGSQCSPRNERSAAVWVAPARAQPVLAQHRFTSSVALFDAPRGEGHRVSRARVEFIGLNRGHAGAGPLPETFSHKV